jgi:syntaxin 1B/2/3
MTTQYQQGHGPYGPYDTTNNRNSRDYQSPYSNVETAPYHPPAQRDPPTQQDFLNRVSYIKGEIDSLSSNISGIASIHQRAIWSPDDASSSSALEAITTSTQVLITKIRDQIRSLESDSLRVQYITIRESQLRNLKNQLKTKLEEYREAEIAYKKRYQEQIARQYKIINPDATEQELREASEADWGDEGLFERAVSTTPNTLIEAGSMRY